jgi:hypothetical protein
VWASKAGSDAVESLWTMALDGQGDVLIGGDFEGSAPFGSHVLGDSGAGTDAFVSKLFGATGEFSWAIGGSGSGDASVLALDTDSSGAVLATGAFLQSIDFGHGAHMASLRHELFLVKIATSGNLVWSHSWSGTADAFGEALSVVDNASDDIVIGGRFYDGSIDFAPPLSAVEIQAMFVAKLE